MFPFAPLATEVSNASHIIIISYTYITSNAASICIIWDALTKICCAKYVVHTYVYIMLMSCVFSASQTDTTINFLQQQRLMKLKIDS